uniref:Resistance to inhibitors of cholinesterase protein 19 n=1 Tax=Ascaris suum TaxID=6253 RepID=F1L5B1_ASCSU
MYAKAGMSPARFYETSTSGLNFDRFVDRFDESTLTKVRQQYWTAKQLIRSKLGKKEDEHLLASDAEFDAKLSLFRSLRETSDQMLCCIDDYQHFLGELIQAEINFGRMLKEEGRAEKGDTSRAMAAVGRVQTLSAHYRQQIRGPLLRFLSELQVFTERAILDCADTVDAAERSRIEYRGSLLWMKKTSDELDPDTENAMEKFRKAQSVVRRNKERLDGLKLDTLQKVDLLAASRCNLFSQLLECYQKCLYKYFDQTSLAYSKIYDIVSGCKHYQFEVLKDLIEPSLDTTGKAECEEGDAINVESLIEVDEKDQEMNRILFGMDSPDAERTTEERVDSPLGQTEDFTAMSEPAGSGPEIGPLPQKYSTNSQVPRISPPPGWDVARAKKKYSDELIELLAADDVQPKSESFADEWSRLMSAPSSSVVNKSASTAPNAVNLPSQLLDLPTLANQFPNPFNEPNLDAWKCFLSEFDASNHSSEKSC